MTEQVTTEDVDRIYPPVMAGTSAQSMSIAALAAALSALQGELKNPKYDKVNPHYHSKYASLAVMLETVRPLLAKHKLAVCQMPTANGQRVGVTTLLMHESGEWVRSTLYLRPQKDDIHGWCGGITYVKRYSLDSMVGMAGAEDDDGNAAADMEPPAGGSANLDLVKPSSKPARGKPRRQPSGGEPTASYICPNVLDIGPGGEEIRCGHVLRPYKDGHAWFCKQSDGGCGEEWTEEQLKATPGTAG